MDTSTPFTHPPDNYCPERGAMRMRVNQLEAENKRLKERMGAYEEDNVELSNLLQWAEMGNDRLIGIVWELRRLLAKDADYFDLIENDLRASELRQRVTELTGEELV